MGGPAGALLALGVVWALGALLLSALGLRRRRWPLGYAQPSIDFAVGGGILATLWPLAALLGRGMSAGVVWGCLAALGLAAGLCAMRRRRRPRDETENGAPRPIPKRRVRWVIWPVLAVLVLVAGEMAARAHVTNMFWDGRYIWGFKAKAMFVDGGLDREAFSNLARYRYTHQDYPLSVPATEAWMYQVMGQVDERWGKVTGVIYWVGLVGLLGLFLGRRMGLPWGLVVGLMACAPPVITYHATAGAADVPQAFHLLAASLLLFDWVAEGRRSDLLMAALMFGVGALVKAEGLSMALAGALALGAGWWMRGKRVGAREAGAAGLALVLPYLPWAVLRRLWDIRSLQLSRQVVRSWPEMWERLSRTLESFGRQVVAWDRWELVWWVIGVGLAAYLVRRERERPVALLWGIFLWQFGVYVVIYVISPIEIGFHLQTSLERVILHLAPLGVAAAAASLLPGEEVAGAGSGRRAEGSKRRR